MSALVFNRSDCQRAYQRKAKHGVLWPRLVCTESYGPAWLARPPARPDKNNKKYKFDKNRSKHISLCFGQTNLVFPILKSSRFINYRQNICMEIPKTVMFIKTRSLRFSLLLPKTIKMFAGNSFEK